MVSSDGPTRLVIVAALLSERNSLLPPDSLVGVVSISRARVRAYWSGNAVVDLLRPGGDVRLPRVDDRRVLDRRQRLERRPALTLCLQREAQT